MSTQPVAGKECSAVGADQHTFTAYPNRETRLGQMPISRAMPIRDRRMVGPWCFLDRYGPLAFTAEKPMNVPPHPHIGLQTVTWLMEGEVLHTDSLGFQAVARPGAVNVMTAGAGISHAEETPLHNSGRLSGVQLWVALPETERGRVPSFASIETVPAIDTPGATLQVFAGSLDGVTSPAPYFSDIAGFDAQLQPGGAVSCGLRPEFEHAALLLGGDCRLEDQPLQERVLYYLGTRRDRLVLHSQAGGRLLVIGGPPFPETILMWWNFVARTPEEIAAARADWEAARQGADTRFGKISSAHGAMLAAPELVRFARPNPAS